MDNLAEILETLNSYREPLSYSGGYYKLEKLTGLQGRALSLENLTRETLATSVSDTSIKLLEKLAQLIVETPDGSWHHTVCHLFEGYGRGAPSFLDNPRFFPAATILVDKAIELDPNNGNMGRIVKPIINYNLDSAFDGATEQFAFKPASLSSVDFQTLDSRYSHVALWERFAESETPSAFVDSLVADPLPTKVNPIYRLISYLNATKGPDAARELIEKTLAKDQEVGESSRDSRLVRFQEKNGENWVEAVIQDSEEITARVKLLRGAFFDVEGTLIGQNGAFNRILGSYVSHLLDKGVPVTIFTGGDTQGLEAQLIEFGIDKRALPVRSKDDFKGKHFEVLIDDTDPDYQGFYADISVPPFQSFDDKDFVSKLKKKWGQPETLAPPIANKANVNKATATTNLREALGTENAPQQRSWSNLFGFFK